MCETLTDNFGKEWETNTLGKLGFFQNGLNKAKQDFGFGTKFINILDVYPEKLNVDELGRMNANQSEVAIYHLEVGDILIDRSSVKLEGVGYPTIFEGADEPVIFCGFIIRFRLLTPDVNPRFLCKVMRNELFRNRIFQIATRSANVNVNQEQLGKLYVPIPPLNEQQKIAEILDTVDKAIALTQTHISKLKLAKAGLLHDLLTRGIDEHGQLRNPTRNPEQFKDSPLGRIPKDWDVEKFEEHIGYLDSGWSPVCDSELTPEGEWGVLKTTAVVWSGYNSLENKKLPSNLQPKHKAAVEKDDILITRKGPRERVGVVVHIPLTRPKLMIPDTIFRVRLKQSSTLLPAFVPLTLGSVVVKRDWNRKKIGLAEAQVDINYGIVRETFIHIPSTIIQKKIVEINNVYNFRIREKQTRLEKLKLVKKGLMSDLLTGKVRVKI